MQPPDFIPARSKLEAVARLYAVADFPPPKVMLGPGSKERKSVLTSVASRFKLDVDVDSAKDVLAEQVLTACGGSWDPAYASTGQTITLAGLNAILAQAEARAQEEDRTEPRLTTPLFPDWFRPARDKLEAVRRISSLCGGRPQDLGPGSKERKSVLTDLVENLDLGIDTRLPKTRLAAAIALRLQSCWNESCWSTGETITLNGLNAVLAGAENRLLHGHASFRARLQQEASLLVTALAQACPLQWVGRECVTQMLAAEHSKARQTEWVGWYFEFVGLPALVNAYGGGPQRICATEFDYARSFVWDLKTHAQTGPRNADSVCGQALLNDRDSMLRCVEETGSLGFLVLSGTYVPDLDGSFDTWHRHMRGSTQPRTSRSRTLKAAFTPLTVDAYVFEGTESIERALEEKVLAVFAQGRQQSGAPRKQKLTLDLARGRHHGYVKASAPVAATG